MKITRRQLRRIISEEKLKLHEQPEQMVFNQREVDSVRAMAAQIEPMYTTLSQGAGQKVPPDAYEIYEQIEDMLMDLPELLETLAAYLEEPGI